MKQKHTKARKARRFNLWYAYQKVWYSTSVFTRRLEGFYGADSADYDRKHPDMEMAVEGYKSRMNAKKLNYAQRMG